jgi:hypothetical protein
MITIPTRITPLAFEVAEIVTIPGPDPVCPEFIVSQVALLVAFQLQA